MHETAQIAQSILSRNEQIEYHKGQMLKYLQAAPPLWEGVLTAEHNIARLHAEISVYACTLARAVLALPAGE